MADVYPQLSAEELRRLPSAAEGRLYEALRDQLGGRYLVLYSVPFVRPGPRGSHLDGEADFVIFDERGGFAVVEVKGGGVSCNPASGSWESIDRAGMRHTINDPFRQATQQKHEVLRRLQAHRRWGSLGIGRFPVGHAVFFPDLDDTAPLESPHRPRQIIGGHRDLRRLDRWLSGVMNFWAGELDGAALGGQGISIVRDLFCRPIQVRPLMARQLEEEEHRRVQLTEEQARMLRGLGLRRRAAIAGGAGTGKTLLALQKAREIAGEGFRTLLLCYNRPLSDHLKRIVGDHPHLFPMTFHQLCDWRVRQVRETLGRDLIAEARAAYPGEDFFDVLMPYALAVATEALDDPFDAVIVDEGQDFGEEYWLPLELSLRVGEKSLLYVFYDSNQAVYSRASTFPISDAPFLLTVNCRNTRPIHEAAYLYFQGERTDPPQIEGRPLEGICATSIDAQARRLHALVVELLHDERVGPSDVAVLVADGARKGNYYSALQNRPLPDGAAYALETYGLEGAVTVDTVNRFKGLEAAVVFLWGIDTLVNQARHATLYVGITRAKSRLYVVGSKEACGVLTA